MTDTMTLEEYRNLTQTSTPAKPRSKYGNRKARIIWGGVEYTFDSEAEARRFMTLRSLADRGAISDFRVHPVYEIYPRFRRDGKTYQAIRYEADFAYMIDGVIYVEDVKGKRTALYMLKRKMFLDQYRNVTFLEVDAKSV